MAAVEPNGRLEFEVAGRSVVVTATLLMALVARAAAGDLPNPGLTPGAVATTDRSIVCRPGYARAVRPRGLIWRRLKEQAYERYGIGRGHRSTIDVDGVRHPAYEVDHFVPLELGGDPTDIRNLWPEPIQSAREKDKVENDLHDLVCTGQMTLRSAQAAILRDWHTAVPGLKI